MSKAGQDYWRLHVEAEAGVQPKDGPEADAVRARLQSLWETMPQRDRDELARRLAVAKGE